MILYNIDIVETINKDHIIKLPVLHATLWAGCVALPPTPISGMVSMASSGGTSYDRFNWSYISNPYKWPKIPGDRTPINGRE